VRYDGRLEATFGPPPTLVGVPAPPIEIYVGGALARWDAVRRPGQPAVDEPGVCGLLPCADDPRIRLLVTDDRAYDVLEAVLPDALAGMIRILAAATRCAELVGGRAAWKSESVEAMVCRDLETVPAIGLFAAVDGEGAVRATSGWGVFGTQASVIFVNTDPDWRGRGIGQAMTAAALRAAGDRGARQASLDATDAGRSIYRRLGFESAGRATRCSRAG
jgi:ribosomal protein S18 acetylase RimI-like enzyme